MLLYQPLFTISVEHAYFADGLWRGVDFVASPASAKLARGAGILLKSLDNGIGAVCEMDKSQALQLYARDAGGSLPFVFKVYANDKAFMNYTVPAVRSGDRILCLRAFDEETGVPGGSAVESESEYLDVDALVSQGILDEREKRAPPHFVVSIRAKVGPDGIKHVQEFRFRFGARRSFWKYHLLGKMNRSNARIVDLDSKVEFESCGEVMLPGSRLSRVFRSTERLPMSEKSSYRFQLREQEQGVERVLIKRLPVASESRLGLDVVNGNNEIVLENYVNF